MYVLLVNDDGIHSQGLRALRIALVEHGHKVSVVAPERQYSGAGHSLTVYEPLTGREIHEDGFEGYAISGTPADCVKLALGGLLDKRPDLVFSGINLGPNVGPDLSYSGTVGAAAEASHCGIGAMAFSQLAQSWSDTLPHIAAHAVNLAGSIDWQGLPGGVVLNVNYPDRIPGEGEKPCVCAQSPASWEKV